MEENKIAASSSAAKTHEIEDSVTMLDVLKAEEDLEADSTAVLGGSDEKACTYYLVILFNYLKKEEVNLGIFRATLNAKLYILA